VRDATETTMAKTQPASKACTSKVKTKTNNDDDRDDGGDREDAPRRDDDDHREKNGVPTMAAP
jgi:hypothetical protein